jgi:hypothetical protein
MFQQSQMYQPNLKFLMNRLNQCYRLNPMYQQSQMFLMSQCYRLNPMYQQNQMFPMCQKFLMYQ